MSLWFTLRQCSTSGSLLRYRRPPHYRVHLGLAKSLLQPSVACDDSMHFEDQQQAAEQESWETWPFSISSPWEGRKASLSPSLNSNSWAVKLWASFVYFFNLQIFCLSFFFFTIFPIPLLSVFVTLLKHFLSGFQLSQVTLF